MTSIGYSNPSLGGSEGSGDTSDTDENVTHTRGRIDDMLRHLASIRERVTDTTWPQVAGHLDDADAAIEAALDTVLTPKE